MKTGDSSIDGVATVQLTGEAAASDLTVLTGGAIAGDRVRVDQWLARDGNVLHRLQLSELGTATPTSWTLVLSRHDQPVAIEPPP